MRSFFKELFEYNHHQNQKLIKAILDGSDKAGERCESLLSHLLIAHHTWNSRIVNNASNYGIWELIPLAELEILEKANLQTSLHILEERELDSYISYKTSRGDAFSNSIKDILFHIINHSTYHRGQIATEMRNNGLEPVATDYIFYKREPERD